jgi:peptidoglycan hydrolase-like protein with peptidoglycan-binding domain
MSTRRGSYTQYPSRPRRRSSRRGPALALLAILLLIGGALLAVRIEWPAASVTTDPQALAGVRIAPDGEQIQSVVVRDSHGHRVPVRIKDGLVWPTGKLPAGERLTLRATVRRASWVSWLVGATKQVDAAITTPETRVPGTLLHLPPGAPVNLRFGSDGASLVRLKLPGYKLSNLSFTKPRKVLATGLQAVGPNRFGVLTVAVAARTWETLSPPVRVSWFPTGTRLEALVRPAPGTTIQPGTPIELTFSEPVKAVLGATHPSIDPATPGTWVQTAENTLTFRPAGQGYALGRPVVLTLPATTDVLSTAGTQTLHTVTWKVPVGSTLRLQQLLSQLGYLPLSWQAAGAPVPATALAQKQAALHAPTGTFTWRYANTPAELKALWRPSGWTRMTQGAVMAFENDHGLAVDGIPGPIVWHTLIQAVLAGQQAHFYSYVLVKRSVPQTLTLWSDGQVVLTTKVNTGVPAAPTPLGTHTVFEHIPVGTMRGQNPDGSHYVDPGIKWISYFNGGEAIHGFDRATYGFPQSVGCVETPIATAGQIWPYTPIGTLVTIVP